jgi:hypothetical protein
MQPFQGAWKFDLQKTLAQWKADGVPAKEIAGAKRMAQGFPLHQDMTIQGDAAVLSAAGRGAEGEYAFFALHPHNAWTCGKAWHHEDRHDPGDMSKCYARLRLQDTDLHLALRIDANPPNPGDPDIANQPPAAGSSTTCGADAATDPPWSAWRTYVFVKG